MELNIDTGFISQSFVQYIQSVAIKTYKDLIADVKEASLEKLLDNFLINLLQLCFSDDIARSIVLNQTYMSLKILRINIMTSKNEHLFNEIEDNLLYMFQSKEYNHPKQQYDIKFPDECHKHLLKLYLIAQQKYLRHYFVIQIQRMQKQQDDKQKVLKEKQQIILGQIQTIETKMQKVITLVNQISTYNGQCPVDIAKLPKMDAIMSIYQNIIQKAAKEDYYFKLQTIQSRFEQLENNFTALQQKLSFKKDKTPDIKVDPVQNHSQDKTTFIQAVEHEIDELNEEEILQIQQKIEEQEQKLQSQCNQLTQNFAEIEDLNMRIWQIIDKET